MRLSTDDRLLLRLPSWLGDFVSTEPVVRTLFEGYARVGHPERLTLAAPEFLLELFEDRFEGALRQPIEGKREGRGWRGHDVALFFNGALRSAVAAARAGIPRRIGSAKGGRAAFLTEAVEPARERGGTPLELGRAGDWPRALPRPFSAVCIELANALGVQVRRPRPLLFPTDAARLAMRNRLRAAGLDAKQPVVLVNVGARAGSSKGWESARWIALVRQLMRRAQLPIFLSCGPGEEHCVEDVLAGAPHSRIRGLLDPVADLRELVAWCAHAHAIVCTDGGVRHVARATGVPAAILFGPTDPRHTANHNGRERHLRVPVECGPCHEEWCPLPDGEQKHCMRALTVDLVLAVALERIEEGARVRALR